MNMISSKCKGLLGLPPEKCTVEGMEEGQREDGDQEEDGNKRKRNIEREEGKGKRRKGRKRGNE